MNKPSKILKIRESHLYNKNVKDDIKIACVGDIHLSNLAGIDDINNISEVLYNLNPDYICILGDIVDSPDELLKDQKVSEVLSLMGNCSSIAPTMVILGSHDFIDENVDGYPDVIEKTDVWNEINRIPNIHLLNDEIYSDNRIVFGGYRQKREAYYNLYKKRIEDAKAFLEDFKLQTNLYNGIPDDIPKVLLTHSPESIHNITVEQLLSMYNVIITGHYHNGCIPAMLENILPQHFGLITPRKRLFPKESRGIVKLNSGSYLIYNGGWNKITACVPKILHPLNNLCNKQIDLTTLTPNEEHKQEMINVRKLVLKK